MVNRTKLLVEHGFAKGMYKKGKATSLFYEYYEYDENGAAKLKDPKRINELKADEELVEAQRYAYSPSGFPRSTFRHFLKYSIPDLSIEEPYYWTLDTIKAFFPNVDKLEDSFSASENSAFFGVTQQRLGIQQDKVGQYLATIGKMVKELFQMVRELRILDERLEYYNKAKAESTKPIEKRNRKDEITLKGIFIDLVQGGGKSPASVYGMARELEFVTLPDLFFDTPPLKEKELEPYVDGLKGFNDAVLRVLKRHLNHYLMWRTRTHSEHQTRKEFMLKYLHQHYEIIQMYISWIKPYLKTAQRLSMKGMHQDSADLISSFEGAMMDIEFIAHNPNLLNCILVTFNYRTRPHMKFVQEGYQRGPVHVGNLDMTIRMYDWNPEQVASYKKLKEKETLELIGDVSGSIRTTMDALGTELEKYLNEAQKVTDEGKVGSEKVASPVQTKSLVRRMFGDFMPAEKKASSSTGSKKYVPKGVNKPFPIAGFVAFNTYHTFKKAHRMVTW